MNSQINFPDSLVGAWLVRARKELLTFKNPKGSEIWVAKGDLPELVAALTRYMETGNLVETRYLVEDGYRDGYFRIRDTHSGSLVGSECPISFKAQEAAQRAADALEANQDD